MLKLDHHGLRHSMLSCSCLRVAHIFCPDCGHVRLIDLQCESQTTWHLACRACRCLQRHIQVNSSKSDAESQAGVSWQEARTEETTQAAENMAEVLGDEPEDSAIAQVVLRQVSSTISAQMLAS